MEGYWWDPASECWMRVHGITSGTHTFQLLHDADGRVITRDGRYLIWCSEDDTAYWAERIDPDESE